ncbi:MAG: asparagine synthase (glutamine-hydrolyzing) [Ignavibacteriales bacterium]|nr:asparagine synthase (glutamine-hydrolyzing) [Ignavibacteriales bacterium]
MCGIAGHVNLRDNLSPPSVELLGQMIGALHHRGPDEFGYYRDAYAGLAHARLSIIDLSTGQQPLCNEDETLWLILNGEIFNYVELRNELKRYHHQFRTQSDTEVIVHAYEQWGEDCFSKFNGQWAIALWDSKRKRFILCRDRVGVRPIFVYEKNNQVWFASEVKAIFADPSITREINPIGMDQIFTYWGTVAPVSIFSGIEEIRPGTMRIYDVGGNQRDKIYWQPSFPIIDKEERQQINKMKLHEATEILDEKLMNATKLRMLRSDVPVGSYLSGGLDSSLVSWMGRQVKEGEFKTFSIRFADAEFDETEYQRIMASTLDSEHQEITVTGKDIAEIFPDVIYHTERPVLRTAPAPLYLLSKLVNNFGFKAVLTGEGADEMFAGYDLFREDKIRRFMANNPDSKIRSKLFDKLYPYLARSPQQAKGMAIEFWKRGLDKVNSSSFSHDPRWNTTSNLKKFFSDEIQKKLQAKKYPDILADLPIEFSSWDQLSRAQYLEILTLFSPYIISSQGDRMLMAHSVEGRFPFLDKDVMEFANNLPPEYKLIGLNEKNILKRLAKGKIPDAIINRKKQPYRAPDAVSFLLEDAPDYVDEMFSEQSLVRTGLFNPKTARSLFEKCKSVIKTGKSILSNNDNMGIVGILSSQLLYFKYIPYNDYSNRRKIEFKTRIDKIG